MPATRFAELLAEPRLFWLTVVVWFAASTANYGVLLWGPTIVGLLYGVSIKDAAHLFVFVSLAGMVGRAIFSLRRRKCRRAERNSATAMTSWVVGWVCVAMRRF